MRNRFSGYAGSIAVVGLAAMTGAAIAEEAHVHGVGKLNLAIDGKVVEMELIAPGADIVGFEHPAETHEDKEAIEAAEKKLADASGLVAFSSGAGCALETVEIEAPGHDDHGEHGHDDHDHDDKAHKDEDHKDEHHKDEAHDDHAHDSHAGEQAHEDGDEHAAHDDDEDVHSEFHAVYRFSCSDAEALEWMEFSYFDLFPGAEELEVQALTNSGQISKELTRDAPRLTF